MAVVVADEGESSSGSSCCPDGSTAAAAAVNIGSLWLINGILDHLLYSLTYSGKEMGPTLCDDLHNWLSENQMPPAWMGLAVFTACLNRLLATMQATCLSSSFSPLLSLPLGPMVLLVCDELVCEAGLYQL